MTRWSGPESPLPHSADNCRIANRLARLASRHPPTDGGYAVALGHRPADLLDFFAAELGNDADTRITASPMPGFGIVHPLHAKDETAWLAMQLVVDDVQLGVRHHGALLFSMDDFFIE